MAKNHFVVPMYKPGQHADKINMQIVYTATTQDFIGIITTELFQPFYCK